MSKHLVKKVWGSEEILVNAAYCGKRMILMQNYCCSLHKHNLKDETFYIEEGEMLLEIKNNNLSKFYVLAKGQTYRIQPEVFHRFYGLQQTIFYEFSTHDEPEDSIRETKSQMGMPEDMIRKLIMQVKE